MNMATHSTARSHTAARAAADAFATLWGDEQDVDLDLQRVDRMTGNDRSTEPMTIDELNGEEEESLGWHALPALAPAPTMSDKKAGKQPARPQQQQPSKKSPTRSITKSPPRNASKLPHRAHTTRVSSHSPRSPRSTRSASPPGPGHPSISLATSDDEDMDESAEPAANPLAKPSIGAAADDDVDDVDEDCYWDAQEETQEEGPDLVVTKMHRAEEEVLGVSHATMLAVKESRKAPRKAEKRSTGPRGRQGANVRPVVSNLSDSDEKEWDALPARRVAPIGDDQLGVSSDNEEEEDTAANGDSGGVAFTGSVPARPNIDMTPKTRHAANLLEQMMPLGTGRFGKQTREQRLLTAPRGKIETVRGLLGTTEAHPYGPHAEQLLALHAAIETPGAVQIFEAKYNQQRQVKAETKYVMRREELLASASQRKAERIKQHDVTLKACDIYKKAQADRLANAQRVQEAWKKSDAGRR